MITDLTGTTRSLTGTEHAAVEHTAGAVTETHTDPRTRLVDPRGGHTRPLLTRGVTR